MLRLFELAEKIERPALDLLRLRLNANLHVMDCGGPDGYGTRLQIDLHLQAQGMQCFVALTEILSEDWGRDARVAKTSKPSLTERFEVEGGPTDLADPTLEQLTLRSQRGDRALIVRKDGFYYYEDVVSGGELWLSLEPGGGVYPGCCWGATNAGFRFFVLEHR